MPPPTGPAMCASCCENGAKSLLQGFSSPAETGEDKEVGKKKK